MNSLSISKTSSPFIGNISISRMTKQGESSSPFLIYVNPARCNGFAGVPG